MSNSGAEPNEWRDMMEKFKDGIDTAKTTKDELGDYIETRIHVYTQDNFKDYTLWGIYLEDFCEWTMEDFRRARTNAKSKLRALLLQRGVYVARHSNRYPLAKVLFDVVQEEEPHQWTDEELAWNLTEIGPMITISLAKRLNSTLSDLKSPRPSPLSSPLPRPADTIPLPQSPLPPASPQPPPSLTYQQQQVPPSAYDQIQNLLGQLLQNQQPIRQPHMPPPHITPDGDKDNPTPLYSREQTTVLKLYTDEQKYDGVSSSFDFKLTIFHNICKRSGLPPDGYMTAFPIMLKGLALDHFFNSDLEGRTFTEACNHIRHFFEGPEYYRRNLTEWNTQTLQSIIDENPDKKIYQCFQLLVNKLLKQRHGLHPDFRTDMALTNKIVTACQGVPACRIGISNPCEDLSQLINKLQSSIVAWEKEHLSQVLTKSSQDAYFTDRRYHHRNHDDRNDRGNRSYRQNSSRLRGKCYVCQKENCRSWKHTEEERSQSRDEYKNRFKNDKGRNGNFEDRFRQYVITCEGLDEEGVQAFEALVLDTSDVHDTNSSDSDSQYCFITSFGTLTTEEATSISAELANKACAHLLTENTSIQEDDPFSYTATTGSRYTSTVFMGIIIDTAASKKSTGGYGQFQALQKSDPTVSLDTSTRGQVKVQFGIGTTTCIGTTEIMTPVGKVQFHIVPVDTPFLLSLADMDRLQIEFSNLRNVIVTRTQEVPVVRRYGHAFLLWNSPLQSYLTESFNANPCYLTDVELRRLHRRFGHPSVERLHKVLDRAGHDIDKMALEQLTKYCHFCQKYGKSPGRFRFTLRDDIEFNYCVIIDIMYISGKPLLHIVDEATRFQAGRWLQDISAKHTWDVLRMCWIDTYLGPPDLIAHDAGKNFISKEFKEYARTMGIDTKAAPVEAHNSIGMVERYHGPIRRAYQIIMTEIPGIDKEMGLQMAFKAINDSAGPDGLVPTLLVFGAYPRMVQLDAPSLTVTQRASAIKKAMAEIHKLRAERQIADALNMRNGPCTDTIHDLPPSSPVLVWREGNTGQSGRWEGLFTLLTVEGETCTVKLPGGPMTFRSTVVKPYF